MKKTVLFIILSLFSISLFSQEALKSTEEEYYDYLSLKGFVDKPTLGYRTLSDSEWNIKLISDDEQPIWKNNNLGITSTLFCANSSSQNWFLNGIDQSVNMKIYGPEWFNSYNTAVPYGQNDGALWQGRGYNTSFTTGIRFEGYGFELTLKPQLSFSQNKPFDYMKSVHESEYGYFVGGIDLVQRYGDKPFWTFDWGDSEVRWSLYNFTIGFGTQSPWLGPAWLNPMLGSNNAASYPKFDVGFRKTKLYIPFTDIYLGDIEGRLFIGRLEESKYFDNKTDNDYTMLNGLSISYSPSFVPGLTVGGNRIFLTPWKAENLKYIGRLFTLSDGNKYEDQKASLFIDWNFPQVGFQVYGEYGLDDFTSDKNANPFHTGIYTIGLKKTIPFPSKNLDGEIIFEWNNFEMSQDFQMQWQYGGYYFHSQITQGYTNKGQILGAGSGSMGNSQFLGVNLYYPKGNTLFYFHRHSPNNNYVYNKAVDEDASTDGKLKTDLTTSNQISYLYYASFEAYLTWGISSNLYLFNDLLIKTEISLSMYHNALYDRFAPNIFNYKFALTVKYNF